MSEIAHKPQPASAILVVEDERRICELLSEVLEAEGYAVHCVQTDLRAYEALRAGRAFRCMIVDVNLGTDTTGYDVARFARSIDPALPVIYVSGQTSQASLRANGVTGSLFVPKPFTAAELMERVHMLVGDNDD